MSSKQKTKPTNSSSTRYMKMQQRLLITRNNLIMLHGVHSRRVVGPFQVLARRHRVNSWLKIGQLTCYICVEVRGGMKSGVWKTRRDHYFFSRQWINSKISLRYILKQSFLVQLLHLYVYATKDRILLCLILRKIIISKKTVQEVAPLHLYREMIPVNMVRVITILAVV